jgi:hypothetical protein
VSSLTLDFKGPLTFSAGERCLFESEYRDAACVYLWTTQSGLDGSYWIHYIGETGRLSLRHRQHLTQILGLNYGINDVGAAGKETEEYVWRGMWRELRDANRAGPMRCVELYQKLAPDVVKYVEALSVFVAPVDIDRRLREHVEGSIARNLRANYPEFCALYSTDCRTGVGEDRGIRLEITWGAPIAGLDPVLDI